MSVKFIFQKGINELDLLLLNEVLFKLKTKISNETFEYYRLTYDFNHLLKSYNEKQILSSLDHISAISILNNDNEEYRLIIDTTYYIEAKQFLINFINISYLKEYFFIKEKESKIMNEITDNNYQDDPFNIDDMQNVKTKFYTDLTFIIEGIIKTNKTPTTVIYNYHDEIFGDTIIFIIQENHNKIKPRDLKQINDYKYEFYLDDTNKCLIIKLLFPSCYEFKVKLYPNSKYTFRKILKNEKMYVVFYNRETGRTGVNRMSIINFQNDFKKFLDENNILY